MKKGTTTKRAAHGLGGLVHKPTLSQAQAGAEIGQVIPDKAWQEICAAFEAYGSRQRALDASKASRSNGDAQSWHTRQKAASRAIEIAMEKVEAARKKHGRFLDEASENYCLENLRRSYSHEESATMMLDEAFAKLLHAVAIIERANPQEIEIPTAATSRDMLVRDIYAALTGAGIEARLSSGFDLGRLKTVFTKDLTPFEALIAQFGIGDDCSRGARLRQPAAFSAWLRQVLANGKK
jgi:hypothetical protein